MALNWKLVIDCTDPHAQAAFWAAVLGYRVEDNGRLIEQLAEQGAIGPDVYTEIDGTKAFRHARAARHPDDPADPFSDVGLGRRLLFQVVPEKKEGKNRLHIDVHAEPGTREAEVERITALGATVLREVVEPGSHHVVLADPEGNEFCVQ
ncbi:VOC family protein [Actinomadura flavalba]|uniref:VOC family protein n=1 Tax=Actinomadura flavalba TaxID=1120938 RepID=UPI00037716AF|nr:VOC family protein [Actinomadura flavalba]